MCVCVWEVWGKIGRWGLETEMEITGNGDSKQETENRRQEIPRTTTLRRAPSFGSNLPDGTQQEKTKAKGEAPGGDTAHELYISPGPTEERKRKKKAGLPPLCPGPRACRLLEARALQNRRKWRPRETRVLGRERERERGPRIARLGVVLRFVRARRRAQTQIWATA